VEGKRKKIETELEVPRKKVTGRFEDLTRSLNIKTSTNSWEQVALGTFGKFGIITGRVV
jgi:hypothetical protein